MAITDVVFKVWHPLTMVGGGHVSDLTFRDGKPLLVVEWDKRRTSAVVVVQLEWRHLHSMTDTPGVHYFYARRVKFQPSAVRRARDVMFVVIMVIVVIGAIVELFL